MSFKKFSQNTLKAVDWTREKVAVIAGGSSCEREISLISGRAVMEALASKGVPALFIDPTGDFIGKLKNENISMVFLALHGTFGEDGTIQRLLEEEDILYTGSGIEASAAAFDKSKAQVLFLNAGVNTPEFIVITQPEVSTLPRSLSFPVAVKPATSGSSVGITLVMDPTDFKEALTKAFQYSDTVLIDRYIKGRELTVGFLGQEALPIVEVIPKRKFYDYQAKYQDIGTRYEFPAKLTEAEAEQVTKIASKAHKVLGCEVMSRVDVILGGNGEPYVLEVNTIPGLTGKSLLPKAAFAAGIDFPSLCIKILNLSLKTERVRKERTVQNEAH